MSANSFAPKQLRVTLILSGTNAAFPNTNSNTLILTGGPGGLRMSASVQAVARLATQCDISIWGMNPADMDALTLVWANPPIVRDHVVILEADSGDGFTQVFKGTILQAQPDYAAAPNVYFRLQAVTGYFQKINAAPPTSYPGSVSLDEIVADLAGRMGFGFAAGGDTWAVLSSPYLSGTLYDQLQQACQAANADFYFQGDTILITRANLPRSEQPTLVLSPTSGLLGYPTYERAGLNVACLYNAAILCGSPVEIRDSVVPAANGVWYPYSTSHLLEANMPSGAWFSQLFCLRVIGETASP